MFRRTFACCLTSACCATALAQAPALEHPIVAPIRRASMRRLDDGRWIRTSAAAAAVSDVLFDNTCVATAYHALVQGGTLTDEGRLPSASAPATPSVALAGRFDEAPGCASAYVVEAFEIAYCTTESALDATIAFQDSYAPCAAPASVHAFAITGLPTSPGAPVQACWVVSLDVSSAPFTLMADGDGAYDGPSSADLFGWSFTVTSPVAIGSTGPILRGDLSVCSGADGTRPLVPGPLPRSEPGVLPEPAGKHVQRVERGAHRLGAVTRAARA